MGKSFMSWTVDKVIRKTVRITEKAVIHQLDDKKTDKRVYKIPKKIKELSNIVEKNYGDMQVFEWEPQKDCGKVIMYIHGGGYIQNFSLFHWTFLVNICKKTEYGFTAPNYPLLPSYTYKSSYAKVIEYYKEFSKNNDMKNVVLAGDSAGGGYCLSLLQQLRDLNLPLPGKVILISPFVDVAGANKELDKRDVVLDYNATIILGQAWADGDDVREWKISPLYGDLTNLPPIQIYVGTEEVLYDECIEAHKRLKEAGNQVDIYIGQNMGHDFPLQPIPEAKKAIEHMIEFMKD